MRIIISPAKKMREDADHFAVREQPVFLAQTEEILHVLRSMTGDELTIMWGCSEKLARLNLERLQAMDLQAARTPAIFAYEGIQYQHMAPGVFTEQALAYVQEHLRILSGFYGILKPFDGVCSYRLEMQARLKIGQAKNLYEYWDQKIADDLFRETDCIINLASAEYSQCVTRYKPDHVRIVTCVFGARRGGKIIEQGTACKMARGEMVRFMAESQLQKPEDLQNFQCLDFVYAPEESCDSCFTFLKEEH